MALALTEDEVSWTTDAVITYPGDVEVLPDRWIDVAFGEFTPEQRARILYEVGVFNFLQARTVYTEAVQGEDDELEGVGNVLAGMSASFLDAALRQK